MTEWRLYSDEAFDSRPFYFESHRYRRGRRLDPDSPAATHRYGFDGEARIWVEQETTEFRGQQYETFWIHESNGHQEAAGFDYSVEKRPIFLDRFTFESGLLIRYEKEAEQGCKRSVYIYSGSRLVRIEHDAGPTLDHLKPFQIEDIAFDALGRLERVTRHQIGPDGREIGVKMIFEAKPRGLNGKELRQIFLDRLVAAVPAALSTLQHTSTNYCLALAYDPGQFSTLPPTLGLGLTERLGQPSYETWNPATMLQADLTADRFPELCRAAELLDQMPLSEAQLRSLLNDAAARLARINWTDVMPVTKDFIVYATDLELSHLEGNLRKALGDERVDELRRSGSWPT